MIVLEKNLAGLVNAEYEGNIMETENNICPVCKCEYTATKTEVSFDGNDNTYYIDILIEFCPVCGDVLEIKEY